MKTRLSVHMVLTFAIVGAFQPVLAKHLANLGFSDLVIGAVLAAPPLASMITPLFAGQIVDRWISLEKFLAAANLGTGILYLAASRTSTPVPMGLLLLAGSLLFVTSIPLGAALAFRHLANGPRDFPKVRMWGTAGWVLGALTLWQWLNVTGRTLADALAIAGLFALANGAYSLTLPSTPPARGAGGSAAFKALGMLRTPSYALFTGVAFAASFVTAFYFSRLAIFLPTVGVPERHLSAFISIGQVVEVPAVLYLSVVYARLGPKGTIGIGLAAWVLRLALFAWGGFGAALVAVALHGPCFAFGRIGSTMYADEACPRDVRASAQALLSAVMEGAGMFAGTLVAGWAAQRAGGDWRIFWGLPGVVSAGVLLVWVAGFRPRPASTAPRAA